MPVVFLLCLVVAGPLALSGVLFWGLPVWEENGLMEMGGLFFLLLGTAVLTREARLRSPLSAAAGLAAALYLVLTLRELDLRGTAAPAWLAFVLGKGRVLWLTALVCFALGNFWAQRRSISAVVVRQGWTGALRLFAILIGLFLLSTAVTRHSAFGAHATREFLEETCELPMELGFFLLARMIVNHARESRAASSSGGSDLRLCA